MPEPEVVVVTGASSGIGRATTRRFEKAHERSVQLGATRHRRGLLAGVAGAALAAGGALAARGD